MGGTVNVPVEKIVIIPGAVQSHAALTLYEMT